MATEMRFSLDDVMRQMLVIKGLDPSASVELSEYTLGWYVDARIHVGGDGMLTGITNHQATPDEAVSAFFGEITSIPRDRYLVTDGRTDRRHWRWNGAAFVEQPIERAAV